jgi:hypothetical protein
MRDLHPDALAAILSGEALVGFAVKISGPGLPSPFCAHTGYHPVTVGSDVYLGVGDRGMVTSTGGALGAATTGLQLRLNGLDPAVLPLIDDDDVIGAKVTIDRPIWSGTGSQLLDFSWLEQVGRVETLSREETIGGLASLIVEVSTAAAGLGYSGGRMRSDADQRLISAADGGFKRVAHAGQIGLSWGGKPPQRAAVALPGITGPGGGVGGAGAGGWTEMNMVSSV